MGIPFWNDMLNWIQQRLVAPGEQAKRSFRAAPETESHRLDPRTPSNPAHAP